MFKRNSFFLHLTISVISGILFGLYVSSFYNGMFLSSLFTDVEPSINKAIDISLSQFEKNSDRDTFYLPRVVATKRNINKVLNSKTIQNRLKILAIEGLDLKLLENKINLIKLDQLSVVDCASKHQPTSIYQVNTLTSLEIGNCNLEIVDDGISNLTLLTSLKLYKNNLQSLPNNFFSLQNLQTLDLRSNQFSQIPEVLYQMPNLKEVHLDGNLIQRNEINFFQEYLRQKQEPN